jgi:hypothetical protein
VFLYDNDKAGRTACEKLRKLNPLANAWTVTISPDDMTDKQIEEMMEKVVAKAKLRRVK